MSHLERLASRPAMPGAACAMASPLQIFAPCKASGQHDGRAPLRRQLQRLDPASLAPDWIAPAEHAGSARLTRIGRRVASILAALVLLVGTLPVMLLAALLVRLSSPGPVLYRQQRVGLGGRSFMLLKFRSMGVDAEEQGIPAWAAQDDKRVTWAGAILRRSRIDELPQLLNVLRGEMVLIGPRPERPYFVDQLLAAIPFYADRHRVKPGITGWAQVNHPYGASVEDAWEKLSYDLYYVKNRSLLLDARIVLSTIRVVLFQVGAR